MDAQIADGMSRFSDRVVRFLERVRASRRQNPGRKRGGLSDAIRGLSAQRVDRAARRRPIARRTLRRRAECVDHHDVHRWRTGLHDPSSTSPPTRARCFRRGGLLRRDRAAPSRRSRDRRIHPHRGAARYGRTFSGITLYHATSSVFGGRAFRRRLRRRDGARRSLGLLPPRLLPGSVVRTARLSRGDGANRLHGDGLSRGARAHRSALSPSCDRQTPSARPCSGRSPAWRRLRAARRAPNGSSRRGRAHNFERRCARNSLSRTSPAKAGDPLAPRRRSHRIDPPSRNIVAILLRVAPNRRQRSEPAVYRAHANAHVGRQVCRAARRQEGETRNETSGIWRSYRARRCARGRLRRLCSRQY